MFIILILILTSTFAGSPLAGNDFGSLSSVGCGGHLEVICEDEPLCGELMEALRWILGESTKPECVLDVVQTALLPYHRLVAETAVMLGIIRKDCLQRGFLVAEDAMGAEFVNKCSNSTSACRFILHTHSWCSGAQFTNCIIVPYNRTCYFSAKC